MLLSTSILCIFYVTRVNCKYCALDNISPDLIQQTKLAEHLLSKYDRFKSPQNTTSVKMRFLLKYFYFDSSEEMFNIYNWVFFTWEDERLKWDVQKYGNMSEIIVSNRQIWFPMLKHQTATKVYDDLITSSCKVSNSGHVFCASQILSETECDTDLTDWPYDTQTCTFKYGGYTKYNDDYIFTFNSTRGVSMFGAEYGPGWNIIDFKKGENETCETQFYFTFVVERQAANLGDITVFPCVVLSILTVSSLFLDVDSTRGGITILSLLGHINILTFVSLNIPKYSATVPSILHFITSSLAVTTFTTMLTAALSFLLKIKSPPRQWTITLTDKVFKSSLKFLIQPRWRASHPELVVEENKEALEVWTGFANILNSASIVVTVIVYISIFSSFIPKPLPIDDSVL